MQRINLIWTLSFAPLLLAVAAPAQVLAPEEIRDPGMRELQKKYFPALKQITAAAAAHNFPYRFYFSRTLDVAEKEQAGTDQRSVQFDRYREKTVLKITGNYYAAYSAELMKPEERARQTYQDVILPLLQAAVPALDHADALQAFAFEISHHVRRKVIGVSSEGTENVVLILPKDAAQRLVAATDTGAQRAALLEGETYLNAAPISLYRPPPVQISSLAPIPSLPPAKATAPLPEPLAKSPAVALERATSPEALKGVQGTWQGALDKMVQELNSQAHFVRYAPPAFIPFHKGVYLQLSLTTALLESAAGSEYKLAALAFDQHIAHLIRPSLTYFKDDHGDFDGIDFATTVRLGDKDSEGGQVAVEFVFPLTMLRTYEQFDCTGQQLIDSGFVLINGERVSLNLQNAEAGMPSR
jgi:hypothetical protein